MIVVGAEDSLISKADVNTEVVFAVVNLMADKALDDQGLGGILKMLLKTTLST